jgi:hypothetical protein
MKNGKPSLIFDIRYFFGNRHSYLNDHTTTAYGRRLAWYLNSLGISLGSYHSLYIHFTPEKPTGVVELDFYKGGGELWWLRYAHVGVALDFPDTDDAREMAMKGTVSALRVLLPNSHEIIEKADTVVRQEADDLRFLVREIAYKRYSVRIATTIAAHPEPSHLYATVAEVTTGAYAETPGLPIGPYTNAFDEARSISLRDFDIGHSAGDSLEMDWCERIRNGWAKAKPNLSSMSPPKYSELVQRQ